MPKTFFFVFVLGSSIMSIVLSFFLSLPILYFIIALELFLLSCFMNVLTVTSLLIWQMNTASSTNRFKSRVFVFVASFYRHQSIRNGTTVSNCSNTFWLSVDSEDGDGVLLVSQYRWAENWTRTATSCPAPSICLASLPAGPERFSLSVKT